MTGENIKRANETKRYNNYHKHDHYGNPVTIDTVTKIEDYCKRAVELGHDTIFTTNHGFQGNLFETLKLSEKYGLKMVVGVEAYYVKNRFEKDRSNKHLVIIAKTNEGIRQINSIISEANITGFYHKPRIDDELLFSLSSKDVFITSACVAGIWDDVELIIKLHNYFGDHFYLEVQSHNAEFQKDVNRKILKLSSELGIDIIHGNDSHYIYEKDSRYRELFLKGKGFNYPEEEDCILDYPDYETIVQRYKMQGILNDEQIERAISNTLIFDICEEQNIIDRKIKLPSVSENPTQELRKIIYEAWEQEKKNITIDRHNEYEEAIKFELDIVEKTNMQNYFILDYQVAKLAQEKYGGTLTKTGRGSAPSFYINKLLGLTDIDRLAAPVTLFPTRFMSVERILTTVSLPD